MTGGQVNSLLAPYGRKIGPDPASINAAMIGGIAANNASGMCCGTAENSYKTVAGMRIILADGQYLIQLMTSVKKIHSANHIQNFFQILKILQNLLKENTRSGRKDQEEV